MTRVGTVTFARSAVKSVVHERMHSRAACTSACRPQAEGLLLLRLGDLELAVRAEEVAGEAVEEAARVGLERGLAAGDRVVVERAVGVVAVELEARGDGGREDRAVHALGPVRCRGSGPPHRHPSRTRRA